MSFKSSTLHTGHNINMREDWKPVIGYEGFYEISNKGKLKSLHYNKVKISKKYLSKHGYVVGYLSKKGCVKTLKIHRLVAQAFIPNKRNKPCVNHIDSNRTNNLVSNLEWCTVKENVHHSSKKGRMLKPNLKEKDVLEIRKKFHNNNKKGILDELSFKYKISASSIYNVVKRKSWKHV